MAGWEPAAAGGCLPDGERGVKSSPRRPFSREKAGGGRPALALHVCCGPCATVVLERLVPRFTVWPVWYNPNITDPAEHQRRLAAAAEACQRSGVSLTILPCGDVRFLEIARGLENEPEGGQRCELCFALRLGVVARWAAAHACSLLTTTLTVGPQKDAGQVHAAGQQAAQEAGIEWLAETFRKANGFRRSCELARQMGLYRQDYCGCVFSRLSAYRRRGGL